MRRTRAMWMAAAAGAADWPQFCGPDRNNVSAETGLAGTWPADGPKVLWETEVHDGYAAPAVKDGKVYFIDRAGEESLLRCLDLQSGKPLWSVAVPDPGEMKGKKFEGSRGTPTVTGDAIYFVTGFGTFACIDPATRKVAWLHHLVADYGGELNQFGIAQSPFVHGDRVLVAPHAEDAGVAAYDRRSGKRAWVSKGLGKHAFVSPRVATICGQEMVLAAGSKEKPERVRGRRNEPAGEEAAKELVQGRVVGLSPKDGSVLWEYTGWQCQIAIPHPVDIPGDRLFLTGGYDAGSAMIRIVRRGGGFAVEELYTTTDVEAQVQQPILVGDHLLVGSNTNNRKDGLACFHIDGQLAWRTRDIEGAPNIERGPFILADGKLILLDGKTGVLHLARADASGYRELASAKMVRENSMPWAPLALSDGKLLLRDWNTLKCVDLK